MCIICVSKSGVRQPTERELYFIDHYQKTRLPKPFMQRRRHDE